MYQDGVGSRTGASDPRALHRGHTDIALQLDVRPAAPLIATVITPEGACAGDGDVVRALPVNS
jgi:hypothetical protein